MRRFFSRVPARLLLLAAIGLYLAVVIRTAWISDDAYITFRTIDHWAAGNGLVWNAGERVQTFTHPAWLLIIGAALSVTHEFWLTTLAISLILSSAAVAVYAFLLARNVQWGLVGILTLVFSRAFIDYSTSGLENPLSHFLIAAFGVAWFRLKDSPAKLAVLSLIGAGLMLARQDYLLLIGPALAYQFYRTPAPLRGRARAVLLGLAPLILWEAFSVWYYGFPFPNTAYAKLGTGFPRSMLIAQGAHYLGYSLVHDPATVVMTIAGALVGFFAAQTRGERMLTIGIPLYLGYVLWIGGDFMAGRFYAAPLVMAVILLGRLESVGWRWLIPAAGVVLLGFLSDYPTVFSGIDYGHSREDVIDRHGIADERAFYFQGTGLLQLTRKSEMPDHRFMYRAIQEGAEQPQVLMITTAGLFGYYVGRDVHLVDQFGLGDALLARLEAEPLPDWRIGHPWRRLPEGYLMSIGTGQNHIQDVHLRRYYDHLSQIIAGDLGDPARLWTILLFNLGAYDDLVDTYAAGLPLSVSLEALEDPSSEGLPQDAMGRFEMPSTGVEILLGSSRHDRAAHLFLEGSADFGILFLAGETEVGRSGVELVGSDSAIHSVAVEVPWPAAVFGYDRIQIIPVLTDGRFSMLPPSFGD